VTRVVIVGKGAPERGGIPSFLALLLDSRLAHEFDLEFVNLAGRPQVGGRPTIGNIMRTVGDAGRVWRAARGADVVHIHSALAPGVTLIRAGILALAGRAGGARTIVHGHGGRIELWLTTPARRRVARIALRAADTVVAVSAGSVAALEGALPATSVRLVENGVDTARFTAPGTHDGRSGTGTPRILFVGTLTPRKGVVDLCVASDRIEALGVAHEVLLVGGMPDEGPDARREALAAAEARPGRVIVGGARSPEEMPATYRAAEVFCLPSWWEAMPLSILEAMAAGLPVVATNVGDVGRIVEDGVTGLVVAPRDPDALAAALAGLLADPERRSRLGAAGRRTAETRWSSERTIDRLGELYAAEAARSA
jgi:glycosyltransferase involved in cell wall biosynthesis